MSERMWSVETMRIINELTPDITGKAFDPDWFLLRQRFEKIDCELAAAKERIGELKADIRQVAGGGKTLVRCGCLGCLTDDCDHWSNDCRLNIHGSPDLCLIGRTVAAMQDGGCE